MRYQLKILDEAAGAGDGEPARPRRGKSGRTGWTANQIPSGVGWVLTVRSVLDDPDTLEISIQRRNFLENPLLSYFYLHNDPSSLPDPFFFPAAPPSDLPAGSRSEETQRVRPLLLNTFSASPRLAAVQCEAAFVPMVRGQRH